MTISININHAEQVAYNLRIKLSFSRFLVKELLELLLGNNTVPVQVKLIEFVL